MINDKSCDSKIHLVWGESSSLKKREGFNSEGVFAVPMVSACRQVTSVTEVGRQGALYCRFRLVLP